MNEYVKKMGYDRERDIDKVNRVRPGCRRVTPFVFRSRRMLAVAAVMVHYFISEATHVRSFHRHVLRTNRGTIDSTFRVTCFLIGRPP